jgi:iron only hydrogenase large subunit-like protein
VGRGDCIVTGQGGAAGGKNGVRKVEVDGAACLGVCVGGGGALHNQWSKLAASCNSQ